jgi:hypothetical protein
MDGREKHALLCAPTQKACFTRTLDAPCCLSSAGRVGTPRPPSPDRERGVGGAKISGNPPGRDRALVKFLFPQNSHFAIQAGFR